MNFFAMNAAGAIEAESPLLPIDPEFENFTQFFLTADDWGHIVSKVV